MHPFFSGLIALAVSVPALAQHAPHAHGVAELRVVVDGARVQIELDSPLDNLVGFEHAPKNAQQRKALAEAEARLRDFGALFTLPPAAGCGVQAMELVSPFAEGDGAAERRREAGHGHADLHVAYTLKCARPQALDQLGVKLTDVFPRMRRIRAETATPSGQGGAVLEKSRRTLRL